MANTNFGSPVHLFVRSGVAWVPMTQPAGGTGGTASTDEAAFSAGASQGTPAMGAYESSPTALTNGQMGIIALDANRNVKVNVVAGSGSNPAAGTVGDPVPASADSIGYSDPSGDLRNFRLDSLDYDTGAGSKPQTIMGLALPASGGPVAGGTSSNPIRTDPTGTTTQPVSVAAGTNLIGKVSASAETSTIYDGTTALTPKFAAIGAASSGNNTLVAAVSSKKIRVLSMFIMSSGTVNIYFVSNAGGTVIFGDSTTKIQLVANVGFVLPYNPTGWFENASTNQDLIVNLSASVGISGGMSYIEV